MKCYDVMYFESKKTFFLLAYELRYYYVNYTISPRTKKYKSGTQCFSVVFVVIHNSLFCGFLVKTEPKNVDQFIRKSMLTESRTWIFL